MSDERCRHDRITFSRTCEIRRCYDCEPLRHDATLLLITTLELAKEHVGHEHWCRFDDYGECNCGALKAIAAIEDALK